VNGRAMSALIRSRLIYLRCGEPCTAVNRHAHGRDRQSHTPIHVRFASKADKRADVSLSPLSADSCIAANHLFHHLVGSGEQHGQARQDKTKHPRSFRMNERAAETLLVSLDGLDKMS
jgi:hypothetical protein